jgi:hypothetical protein
MPLLSGLSTGVKQGVRFRAAALEGAVGGENRSIVCQPLGLLRCADVAEPLLNALHHHVPDHLAGDSGRCRHPADDAGVRSKRE